MKRYSYRHYMDKAKGRQYNNENVDQLIEEKNNSRPLECKGDVQDLKI